MGDGVIDGRGYAKLKGKDFSWWEMARKAEPKNDFYYSTRLLVANHADGLVLYRITLHNSPNFDVNVGGTNGFTAWGVHLLTPTDRTLDARNTDGIDPGGSTNVTVAHSWIPDYKRIVLENVYAETPGDVLIAGLNEDHRTQIALRNVIVKGIKPAQIHLAYDDIVTAPPGTDLTFAGKSVRVVEFTKDTPEPEDSPFSHRPAAKFFCEGVFVPMR